MTTFRAIGVSASPTDTKDAQQRPIYKALVDIVAVTDVPAETKTLSRQLFVIISEADLVIQCAAVLATLKAREQAAQLAMNIPRKTLAEVTVDDLVVPK